MELCWLTCVSSELNGGELTRSGGVDALGRLLQRCLDVLPRDAAPTLPATVISTHCLRTFAGMASFPDARQQLADKYAQAPGAPCFKFTASASHGCLPKCSAPLPARSASNASAAWALSGVTSEGAAEMTGNLHAGKAWWPT